MVRRTFVPAGIVVLAGVALAGPPASLPLATLVRFLSWMLVMVIPGVALHRLVARSGSLGEAVLAGFILSPVMVAVFGALGLWMGASPVAAARGFIVLAAAGALVAARVQRVPFTLPARRETLVFLAFVAAFVLLTAFLPVTREWWRVRSDAWFHAAVVAQIEYAGVPPEDPYFAGVQLQYMWFYHVLVLVLARILDLDSFWPMALLNVHALVGLSLAVFYLAGVFRDRFVYRLAATATVLLAFNAAFWVFLPFKALKAFSGEVRGAEELARTFALSPLHYKTAFRFLETYYNPVFFLDKFMVGTAFGLALAWMTAAWASACRYTTTPRPEQLWLFGGALVGMLGFHSIVGAVTIAGVWGGLALTHLRRAHVASYQPRTAAVLAAVSLGALVAMAPYLYQVTHLRDTSGTLPVGFGIRKLAATAIPCAFVFVVAWRETRMRQDTSWPARFFVFGSLAAALFALLLRLPGVNDNQKPGYFVFIPLAVVAGFGLVTSLTARAGARRVATAVAWSLLFFLPVNAIALIHFYGTPVREEVTSDEKAMAHWVRANTPRDAVFIEDEDRVSLLVTGPRRYLFGSWDYALQWGYSKPEMARRFHACRALYASAPIDATTLDVLASVAAPLFVVMRGRHRDAGAVVSTHPELFSVVHAEGDLAILRVDAGACRRAIASAPAAISDQELIRESGL